MVELEGMALGFSMVFATRFHPRSWPDLPAKALEGCTVAMNLPGNPSKSLIALNPHLFGRQPSRTAVAVNREADLHADIYDECRRRGWIALHGSMAERTCRTLGEPDFVILASQGRTFFIECKTRTGKLSPAQLAMKVHAEKLGHTIHTVRSIAEFLTICEDV